MSIEALLTQTSPSKMLRFKNEHIIIVDPGKNGVKIFNVEEGNIEHVDLFPSKSIQVSTFLGRESNGKQTQLEYNKEKFLVGDVPNGSFNFVPSKVDPHHQHCIYSAIAKFVKPGEKITLLVGFPSSDFQNINEINKYRHMILGYPTTAEQVGKIDLIANGKAINFEIEHLQIFSEGMATYTRLTNATKPEAFHVIDLGGENLNYRFYNEAQNSSNPVSLDQAGMNHLETEFKKALRKVVDVRRINVDAINIQQAILTRQIPNVTELAGYESVEAFVSAVVHLFITQNIESKLPEVNFEQIGYRFIFTGGGSLLLRSYFEERYPANASNFIFSKRATWDNCASYLISYVLEKARKNEITYEAANQIFVDVANQLSSSSFEARRRQAEPFQFNQYA